MPDAPFSDFDAAALTYSRRVHTHLRFGKLYFLIGADDDEEMELTWFPERDITSGKAFIVNSIPIRVLLSIPMDRLADHADNVANEMRDQYSKAIISGISGAGV